MNARQLVIELDSLRAIFDSVILVIDPSNVEEADLNTGRMYIIQDFNVGTTVYKGKAVITLYNEKVKSND